MEEVKEVAVWQRCKSPCVGFTEEQQCFENEVLQIGLLARPISLNQCLCKNKYMSNRVMAWLCIWIMCRYAWCLRDTLHSWWFNHIWGWFDKLVSESYTKGMSYLVHHKQVINVCPKILLSIIGIPCMNKGGDIWKGIGKQTSKMSNIE